MYTPKDVRGHFSSLWEKNGPVPTPTSVTSQRKSYARQNEAAKKARLLAEISALTGSPASAISRSIDGISRRWTGVKANKSD